MGTTPTLAAAAALAAGPDPLPRLGLHLLQPPLGRGLAGLEVGVSDVLEGLHGVLELLGAASPLALLHPPELVGLVHSWNIGLKAQAETQERNPTYCTKA